MAATRFSLTGKELPVHIVEDHDGALPLIYRAIGAKKLPFSGVALIHFDAHPDLLSPNIRADECVDKEKLFAYTSIAEWILPAVYMKHVGCVAWLKPPWASQIPDGVYQLCVGKDCATGHIRVATPLPYFISELIYIPANELVNCTTIPLHVITVRPTVQDEKKEDCETVPVATGSTTSLTGLTGKGDDSESPSFPQQKVCQSIYSCSPQCKDSPPAVKKPKIAQHDEEVGGPCGRESPLLTHIDCSTRGETRSNTTSSIETSLTAVSHPVSHSVLQEGATREVSHSVLQEGATRELSSVIESVDAWILDIDLDFFSTGNPFSSAFTDAQHEHLRTLYQFVEPENPNSPDAIAECVHKRKLQLDSLKQLWSGDSDNPTEVLNSEMVQKIWAIIGTVKDGAVVSAEDIHLAGMMTDLPEHVSTDEEVSDLAVAVYELLKQSCSHGREPSMVTIARSAVDDYTPPSQVDFIQTLALATLGELYSSLHVQHHYRNDDQYEHPASSDYDSTDSELP